MMDLNTYLLFILASAALGCIPGPNVALIVANSLQHGTRYGLSCVAGTSSAMIPQLTLTALGTGFLLTTMANAFEYIKWIGAAYLIYLGLRAWFTPIKENAMDAHADQKAIAYKAAYLRGFWISATNPKTLLFFGAFLPQFINAQGLFWAQMCVLSVTFIIVVSIIDSLWATLAGKARQFIKHYAHLHHKISGAFFMSAGLGLAFIKK